MLPTIEHYETYGYRLGLTIGPVDRYFWDTKRWDHGWLPQIRKTVGYDDPLGVGTYTRALDDVTERAKCAAVSGFQDGAMRIPPDEYVFR